MIRFALMLVASMLATIEPAGNALSGLDSQLTKLKADTALVFPSDAVDEHPLWSPDGRFLAVNVEGEWQRVDLTAVILEAGSWRRGQALGVITNREAISVAPATDIAAWQKSNTLRPRRATVGGADVQLQASELSTALVLTFPGRKPETRWQSDMENCHSLVVAPDKRHVAFICEMNGVFILRVGEGGA